MFETRSHPFLVPYTGTFTVKDARTIPLVGAPGRKACMVQLQKLVKELDDVQRMLYANGQYSLLLIFQAMDAAGKDSTIRAVMNGIDPSGCQVFSFKAPSTLERAHDFLWRTTIRLPERGKIGIFNRSYYEEVLVVRVHSQYLEMQSLPNHIDLERLWEDRHESILDHEKHLARNGTIILKFWLNVSKAEQKKRFLSRLSHPQKHWKFAQADVDERQLWGKYMRAYEDCLNATSRPWAPWYAIPADDKPYMRLCVAQIIVDTLKSLGLEYPKVGIKEKAQFSRMKKKLEKGG
ncbi:PPK2 family polyphosphate kinase [Candidatus Nitronereus thalassa]|uniref:Polyphosphate kinase 2 family protein n=1 Tax=Candidatus Nitronereus thalassa TaxID=3020898 RepID=A0ABU3K9T8_9BACT|nr:PPK2 family polyphosphate kinase [Candidatus Nitronereus thalassa]MDT7043156.1 polyphosphate kinase 2 family protein [Candidatus Nitronereus thalassa]